MKYLLDKSAGPLSYVVPAWAARGESEPDHTPGADPDPMIPLRFEHSETPIEVPDEAIKYLLYMPGRKGGKMGCQHFLEMIAAGVLRFARQELERLGYKGRLPGSVDAALGEDAAYTEHKLQLERLEAEKKALAEGQARQLEILKLQAQIAADEKAKAEADARKAEALAEVEAAKARAAEAKAAKAEKPVAVISDPVVAVVK